MRKYGFNNFTIKILEDNVINLDEAEQKYISEMKPHYNMVAGGTGGDTSSSPNFKKSMKEYHKNKSKDSYATYGMLGKSHPFKGKKRKGKPVSCGGIIFDSLVKAEDYFKGISVRKRLDNPKYPTFFRM